MQFLYFSENQEGRITGRAQSVRTSADSAYYGEPENKVVTGERSGDSVTISIGPGGDYSGTLTDDRLTLLIPGATGEIQTLEYRRATVRDYNNAVRAFQKSLAGRADEASAAQATAEVGPIGYLGEFPEHVIFYQLAFSGQDITGTAEGSYITADDPNNAQPISYYVSGTRSGTRIKLMLTDRGSGETNANTGTLQGDVMKLRIQLGGGTVTNEYRRATAQEYGVAADALESSLHSWNDTAKGIGMAVYRPEFLPKYAVAPPEITMATEAEYPSIRAEYYGGVTIVETAQPIEPTEEAVRVRGATKAFYGTLDGRRALWAKIGPTWIGIAASSDRHRLRIAESLTFVTP